MFLFLFNQDTRKLIRKIENKLINWQLAVLFNKKYLNIFIYIHIMYYILLRYQINPEKSFSDYFHVKRNTIVVTVFFLLNQSENCYYNLN